MLNLLGKNGNVWGIAPTIISMIEATGINIDDKVTEALDFLPQYIAEKQNEYQQKAPELDINLMVSFYQDELYFIPVGLEKVNAIIGEEEKEIIGVTKTFEKINVSEFIQGIRVTKIIEIMKDNPDTPMMEAIEKSRLK